MQHGYKKLPESERLINLSIYLRSTLFSLMPMTSEVVMEVYAVINYKIMNSDNGLPPFIFDI